ncbi:MAG TPA: acetaldehyde dehydrogenase (acetylating) [Streptosporangiaceae bacterium]|nr:acetaldehyde dehydrogenase (acetylating) [Streptosporangiaceae bacterium]
MTLRCAVMGSGNIGTDLMIKLLRSDALDLVALVGIDPGSDGLARASSLGIEASHTGIDWVRDHAGDIDLLFDATSAYVHVRNAPVLAELGIAAIDLTPAARGPKVVPTVNLTEHLGASNLNMITCGGQATVPIVAAVSRAADVPYAEMVSTVASRSAGPGTRQNIDEFTRTTARALEEIGGAGIGKAIIVLNPADPPILMRNTVFCALPDGTDHDAVVASVEQMVADVASYVPGYRLKNRPVIEEGPFGAPGGTVPHRVVVLLEVEGAGDYLPTYAGNLDIMTASAVRVGEAKAGHLSGALA